LGPQPQLTIIGVLIARIASGVGPGDDAAALVLDQPGFRPRARAVQSKNDSLDHFLTSLVHQNLVGPGPADIALGDIAGRIIFGDDL